MIEQRVAVGTGIGFGAEVRSKDEAKSAGELFKQVEPEDLVKYGLILNSLVVYRLPQR